MIQSCLHCHHDRRESDAPEVVSSHLHPTILRARTRPIWFHESQAHAFVLIQNGGGRTQAHQELAVTSIRLIFLVLFVFVCMFLQFFIFCWFAYYCVAKILPVCMGESLTAHEQDSDLLPRVK